MTTTAKIVRTLGLTAAVVAGVAGCSSAPDVYTYEVWGAAGSAMVIYAHDSDGNFTTQPTVPLPWSTDVDMKGARLVTPLSLQATAADGVAEVHCRIKHGADVLAESVGSAAVVCDATS